MHDAGQVWPDAGLAWQAPCTCATGIDIQTKETFMLMLAAPVLAAAGWSFLYLLFGGGLGGAFLIFVVLKLLGR